MIRERVWLVGIAAATAAAYGTRWLPDAWALSWLLRVLAANVLIGVIPGMLTVLAWRRNSVCGFLEFIGLSIAISLAIGEAVTIVALTLHVPPTTGLAILGLISATHFVLAYRRHNGIAVRIDAADAAFSVAIAVIGIFLYGAGSPLDGAEDRYHISFIQRLAYLGAPSSTAFFYSPGAAYLYPFPGMHYMAALMARFGGMDALFLYHKLRAFWGVAAMVIFYGCARALFETTRVTVAATAAMAALVANGTFASVPGLSWAQMVPFSHAADVAMGVLLPALLLLTLGFLLATDRHDQRFFFAATVGLACTAIAMHPRELLQLLVYLVAFIAAIVLMRGPRALALHAAILIVSIVVPLVSYRLWYESAAQTLAAGGVAVAQYATVLDERARLWGLLTEHSWTELFGEPLPLLERYMPAFKMLFFGWNPIILVVSPFVLALIRRPVAWLPAASIAVYAAIMALPAAAALFAYVTYFEALYTPVRNVVFFVHLLAGVCIYVAAARLARRSYLVLCSASLGIGLASIALFRWFGPLAAEWPRVFLLGIICGYVVVFGWLRLKGSASTAVDWMERPRGRWMLAYSLIVVSIVAGTWDRDNSVLRGSWVNRAATPDALLASLECPVDGQFCPPPRPLIAFARDRISPDAVFAVDFHDVYQPSLFIPQQMVVWTGELEGIPDPERIFARYYTHLRRARAAGRDQPFFDPAERREERVAFLQDVGATHVLLNPRLYSSMKGVLSNDPMFISQYDDGRWAIFEIAR